MASCCLFFECLCFREGSHIIATLAGALSQYLITRGYWSPMRLSGEWKIMTCTGDDPLR
uniref:Uncharacterized protein n=1 Tax=Rhizophora mucronata TaxID=61149 RepID=A0A2P2K8C2_RHIMU